MSTVQELAESTLGTAERFSVKAELARADHELDPGETVEMLAVGRYEGVGNSLIILTDRRIVALNETGPMFRKKLQAHDLRFSRITSVQSENGRVHGKIILNTNSGDIEIEKMLPTGRAVEMGRALRSRL
jgi:hypothetical protein